MNAKQIIAITTLAFAGGTAMADDITIVEDNFVAAKTRAEVQAELRNSPRQPAMHYNPAA